MNGTLRRARIGRAAAGRWAARPGGCRPSVVHHSLWSLVLVTVLSGAASAGEHTPGDLSITGPWSFELPPVSPNGAVYLRIENRGQASDRLVSAHSPIAGRAEMHTHEMAGEVMKMRRVHSVEIPAQGEVAFEPGGLHVMLLGLKKPLVAGERFPLVLEFEKAGAVEVSVEITSR